MGLSVFVFSQFISQRVNTTLSSYPKTLSDDAKTSDDEMREDGKPREDEVSKKINFSLTYA